MKQKVAVGLSGGVDSSVAAALLLEQGYDVTGVYLTCWDGPGCRSEEDRQDALDIALQLGIKFEHLDYQQAYKDKVYEYMIREYEKGRTPNPDVMCNQEIKFGLFYDWAMERGFDYVATGHYAQIKPNAPGVALVRSVDEYKDQTYFLHRVRPKQLGHILFPIGHMTKKQVREEADRLGLLSAHKPDSVGICFIGEVPIRKFLEKRIEPQEGQIILDGMEVGTHTGVWFYTIGQKVALDQQKIKGYDTTRLPHFYVVEKDIEKNILYVGTEDKLYKDQIYLEDVHWITKPADTTNLLMRIRHTGELHKISGFRIQDLPAQAGSGLRISLEKPVKGVAPGQAAVIYQDKVCLGGGIINRGY